MKRESRCSVKKVVRGGSLPGNQSPSPGEGRILEVMANRGNANRNECRGSVDREDRESKRTLSARRRRPRSH